MISRENLHDEDRLQRDLQQAFGKAAALIDDLGAVSAVGAGINAAYENLRRGTACLQEQGIQPKASTTSSFRITWLVPRAQVDAAVRCLHTALVPSDSPPVP